MLLAGPNYPTDLLAEIDTSQPNLSDHLGCLRGCGLVRSHREGRQVRYELASERLAHARGDLVALELEIGNHNYMDGGS